MSFFFFGTLRERPILEVVIDGPGSHLRFVDGHLDGYAARRVREEDYPVLVPVANSRLPGVVVSGLTALDLERIRFFEDAYYEPREVSVLTGEGLLACHVFASPNGCEDLDEDLWAFEHWPAEDREIFRLVAEQFMARFGFVTFEEADADWELYVARAREMVLGRRRVAGKR